MLALGTDRGVALWDLARGTELPFLPIGRSAHVVFESSGDLLTLNRGPRGVRRWPVQLDPDRGRFRIGPPRRLPLPAGGLGGIAEDSSGRIVAAAEFGVAHVLTPDREFPVGPLDDCREVAVSPDGQWLATGSHGQNGAQVWRIADGAPVADLKEVEGLVQVAFSPDRRWLMTSPSPCRLWSVGTWDEARRFSGEGYGFSPDGRYLLVLDSKKVLHLVEPETGRAVAGLESPDSCSVMCATFSPDGLRLAVITNDGPAVHVWDLREIRKRLAEIGLDWDAPPYPEIDPAAGAGPPLPLTAIVDLGGLGGEARPLLLRAQGLVSAGKTSEAIDLLRQAVGQSPDLAEARNHLAWHLVSAAEPLRNAPEAVVHARRATELVPDEAMYLNTYGVALYRAGRFAEAVPALGKSLEVGQGENAAFDLFFLAMAHHRLAHREEARGCFDRAVRWVAAQKNYERQLRRRTRPLPRGSRVRAGHSTRRSARGRLRADTGKAVAVLRSQTLRWLETTAIPTGT